MSPALHCTLPSRLEDVDHTCQRLRDWLAGAGGAAGFAVELVARECLNNAVLHGNGADPARAVRLRAHTRGGWVRLRITDQGPGFNWQRVVQRGPSPEDVPRGRGLPICFQYARRVRFNPCGNQVTALVGPERKGH